jgi:hypothetical protein
MVVAQVFDFWRATKVASVAELSKIARLSASLSPEFSNVARLSLTNKKEFAVVHVPIQDVQSC